MENLVLDPLCDIDVGDHMDVNITFDCMESLYYHRIDGRGLRTFLRIHIVFTYKPGGQEIQLRGGKMGRPDWCRSMFGRLCGRYLRIVVRVEKNCREGNTCGI